MVDPRVEPAELSDNDRLRRQSEVRPATALRGLPTTPAADPRFDQVAGEFADRSRDRAKGSHRN